MKRGFLLFAPFALAAIVFAQDTQDAAALVKKLGSEEYAVREEAQKKLVEMGDKAVPALEEALKSEDLEVRLRAGRALRAIGAQTKQAEAVESEAPVAGQVPARGHFQGMSMSMGPGKVTVTITQSVDGKIETKTYEGASLEELKEKYPELKSHLDGRFQLRMGGRDDFDMDKFWNEWNKGFDSFDEDMRKWQDETRRELEGMRRWMDQWRPQERRAPPDGGMALTGPMLGVRASQPTAVLAAQLDLGGKGLVIEAVEKGSLAERLGLERFDVLLELNGREISGPADVAAALKAAEGGKATAKVLRRAQPVELDEAEGAAK
jgi:hypothetical protein